MHWTQYKQKIIAECKRQGKDTSFTNRFLDYAQKLYKKNVPVISTPAHFSMLVGIEHDYVCKMANAPSSFYRSFYIKKANGKQRRISEPLPDLKYVQKWILENILEKCHVSDYAKAFVKGRDLKGNARFHRSQQIVVTMDIKDFFPSITVFDVHDIFADIGYLDNVCWFLANLCCLNKKLPQGAPTSPYLSNLKMSGFDTEMKEYIKTHNLRYTRYADDLTFSGSFNPHSLICDVSKCLYSYGFKINANKTRVARQNARQEVTGIVVNSHLQIPKEKRKAIRQQVYYIDKYGLDSHVDHIQETRSHYLNHLLGQINFALFVNPKDTEMQKYYVFIKDIVRSYKE